MSPKIKSNDVISLNHVTHFTSDNNHYHRCDWCSSHPLYQDYHDHEWGRPCSESQIVFELLILESLQSGLSWWTVLKKREHMRSCFYQFNPIKLANAGTNEIQTWLLDAQLIRHEKKLISMIRNAQAWLKLEEETGSASAWIWGLVGGRPQINDYSHKEQIPNQTQISKDLSLALREKAFGYLGPVTCYAFMQACGMVMDHLQQCFCYQDCVNEAQQWVLMSK